MRAYGLPRNDDVKNPDSTDRGFYGLKPSIGGRPARCGKYHGQRPTVKAASRRIFKKKARAKTKEEIRTVS
ncbi:MAG: hypothetical protein CSYNP_04178 [Syntrophus sp. SKADARSKE-3]|nr:hypothetical protein [Syntrophus sp. SKADARSKE-3]